LRTECASALRLGSACGEEDDEEGGEEKPPPAAAAPSEAEAAQPTEQQLQEWLELWRRAAGATQAQRIALSRVPTEATRAAWDHGRSGGPCVTWRLDHILFTHRTLALRSRWATLEADPEGVAQGLPNRWTPSDHHPVAASFLPSAAPRLPDEEAVALLARLGDLDARHAQEQEALQREFDEKEASVAAAAKPADVEVQAQSQEEKKGKQKKKSERPPPEVIAVIQERRRRAREQKEAQAQERAAFLAPLGDLELDALEAGGVAPASWAETGRPKL